MTLWCTVSRRVRCPPQSPSLNYTWRGKSQRTGNKWPSKVIAKLLKSPTSVWQLRQTPMKWDQRRFFGSLWSSSARSGRSNRPTTGGLMNSSGRCVRILQFKEFRILWVSRSMRLTPVSLSRWRTWTSSTSARPNFSTCTKWTSKEETRWSSLHTKFSIKSSVKWRWRPWGPWDNLRLRRS